MKHLFLSEWAGRQGQPRSLVSSSRGSNGMQNSASHNALGTVNYSTPAGLTTSSKASTSSSKSSCGGKCGCGGTCGGSNTPKTTSPMSSFLLTTPVKGGKEKLVVQNRDKINIGPQRPKDALPWDPNDPDHINPEYMGGVLGPLNPEDRSFKVIRPLPPDIETIKTAEDYYQVTELTNTDGTVNIDGPSGPIILRDASGRIIKGHDFADSGPCAIQSYRIPKNLGLGPAVVYGDPLDPDASNYETPESEEFRNMVAEYEERQEAFDRINKLLDTSSPLGLAILSFVSALAEDPFMDWTQELQILSARYGIALQDLTNKVNVLYPNLVKLCQEVLGVPFGKAIPSFWTNIQQYLNCKLKLERFQLIGQRISTIGAMNGWKDLPCSQDTKWLKEQRDEVDRCGLFMRQMDIGYLDFARNSSQPPSFKIDSTCKDLEERIEKATKDIFDRINEGCLAKLVNLVGENSVFAKKMKLLMDPAYIKKITIRCFKDFAKDFPGNSEIANAKAKYHRATNTLDLNLAKIGNDDELLARSIFHELIHSLPEPYGFLEVDVRALTSFCFGYDDSQEEMSKLSVLDEICCLSWNVTHGITSEYIIGTHFKYSPSTGEVLILDDNDQPYKVLINGKNYLPKRSNYLCDYTSERIKKACDHPEKRKI